MGLKNKIYIFGYLFLTQHQFEVRRSLVEVITITKKCTKCDEIKKVSNFYKYKRAKDGFAYCCKECEKKYRQRRASIEKNKIKKREDDNRYRLKNREKLRKYAR